MIEETYNYDLVIAKNVGVGPCMHFSILFTINTKFFFSLNIINFTFILLLQKNRKKKMKVSINNDSNPDLQFHP